LKVDSVVVNIVLEERNLLCANLLLWDRAEFLPYKELPVLKPELVIALLSSKRLGGFENKVAAIYNSTENVKHCFSKLIFSYPDYIEATIAINSIKPISFLRSLMCLSEGKHLILDIACLAIRTDWLGIISRNASLHRCWVTSAIYQGISDLDDPYCDAVHPAGLYMISTEFQDFIRQKWMPVVLKYVHLAPELNVVEMLYKLEYESGVKDFDSIDWVQKFCRTDLFSNYDGKYENTQSDGVALRKLIREPDVVIGIGKYLFRELETIDISYKDYRKSVRQFFNNKLI